MMRMKMALTIKTRRMRAEQTSKFSNLMVYFIYLELVEDRGCRYGCARASFCN